MKTPLIYQMTAYDCGPTSVINAFRQLSDRFSNSDENDVRIRVESSYPFPVRVEVMDEIPFIFQRRDICFRAKIEKMEATTIKYSLRPTKRGVYGFGQIRVFAASPIGLVQRRFTCGEAKDVKVYSSCCISMNSWPSPTT